MIPAIRSRITIGMKAPNIGSNLTSGGTVFGMTAVPHLERLAAGVAPTRDEASQIAELLLDEGIDEVQKAALLMGIRAAGATEDALVGFATTLRSRMTVVDFGEPRLVDTCGTGGGCVSFNLSTGAAILAAGAGAKVAKHGNRAVTSACGSADVLEALGIGMASEQNSLKKAMNEAGFAFLFAPLFHGALKAVGPIRKRLGIRTIFNMLGPILSPAGSQRQLVGVYSTSLLQPIAHALRELGAEHALVVCGEDGMDEISPRARTSALEVVGGEVRPRILTPEEFGIEPVSDSALAPGSDAVSNAAIIEEGLRDEQSPRFAAMLPNAAAAVWLSGKANGFESAAGLVRSAAKSGHAWNVVEKLRSITPHVHNS